MSVVFPAPFSPSSACTSPGASVKSTPRSASTSPKRRLMPRMRTAGSVIGSETAGVVDELARQVEATRDHLGQRLHADGLGGVVARQDHVDRQLFGIEEVM